MSELLPCPFCNNSKIKMVCEILFCKGSPTMKPTYHIYCNECWIKTGHFENESLLTDFWNKRIPLLREKCEPDTFAQTAPQTHWTE